MMNTSVAASSASSASSASTSLAVGSSAFSGLPSVPAEKDKDSQWYFTAEELSNSPSRRQGIDSDTELSYRQMTAYLIQEMGQRLKVSQLCINTAIVYMHRFYAFHSFTHFHRNGIASASLFLAAKVEEQPRKLEHVIRAANKCLNQPTSNSTDAFFLEQAQDLVFNENVLLQTLGFDVAIDHPHTHVVKTCHLVKACKDLTKTSYFLASNSLHLTSMCLQYRPTVVACFCIYLACKWSRWEIPQSTEGKHWFHYVDKSVTMELLKQLTDEFIAIYEKSPARLKSKLNSIKALAQGAGNNRPVGKDKKAPADDWKMSDMLKMYHSSINISENSNHSGGGSEHQQQQHSPHMNMPAMLPPPPQQQQQQQSQQQPIQSSSSQQQQQLQQQQQQLQQQIQQMQQQQTQPQLQQQQQQNRKSDMHSSQHRSQSMHSKHSFSAIGDMTDHKSSYKNQQQQQQQSMQSQSGYNNGNQNANVYSSSGRMRGDHSQSSQQATLQPPSAPTNQGSRSSMPLSSSSSGGGRNISSSQGNMRQQVPSGGGMQMDNHNYQKVRERSSSIHSLPSSLHNTMPSHSSGSHKMPSKGDGTTTSSGRMQAPKESKHKIFGTSIPPPPAGMREYSQNSSMTSSGAGGVGGSVNKADTSHDLARGLMSHNARSFANNNNNNNNNLSVTNPVLGSNLAYNMPQSAQHRQSNAGGMVNNSSAGGKTDHSKSIAATSSSSFNMHMQQQQMHKSNIQPDAAAATAFANTSAPAHDMQQSMYSSNQSNQSQSQPHQFSSMMRNVGFDNLMGDPSMYSSNVLPLSQQQSAHAQMTASTAASASASSSASASALFGNNESSDNKMSHNLNIPANSYGAGAVNNNASSTSMETNGAYRSLPTIKTEHSPHKGSQLNREKDRERIKSSPSSKKEKHRHSTSGSSSIPPFGDSNVSGQLSQQQQRSMQYMYKKSAADAQQSGTHGNEQQSAGGGAHGLGGAGAGMKRAMQPTIKMEDEGGVRDSKMNKLDVLAATSGSGSDPPKIGTGGGGGGGSDMGKMSHVVNGIETNPDMVRNLLKESLCTTSALMKQENLLSAPDSKPPAELFAIPYEKDDTSTTSKMNLDAATKPPAIGKLEIQSYGGTAAAAAAPHAAAAEAEDSAEGKDREKHKKNKKEKHKHKEKDKSKDRDREERKKHKKDKDRHKEKERTSERGGGDVSGGGGGRGEQRPEIAARPAESVEPFKIKIRKDVLEGSSLNPPPFKIKIPKDRIIGDLNLSLGGGGGGGGGANTHSSSTSSSSSSHHRNTAAAAASTAAASGSANVLNVNAPPTGSSASVEQQPPPHKPPSNPTLKIKISKDKIESYTGGSYHQHSLSTTTNHNANAATVAAAAAAPPPPATSFSTLPPSASHEQPSVSNTGGFYASYFTPQNQSGSNAGMGSTGSSTGGTHSHSHHSSSGSGSSSKKKDRDRERSRDRDRDRDKKRHCGESSRSAVANLNNSVLPGPGPAIGSSAGGGGGTSSSSGAGNNSHSRSHNSSSSSSSKY